MIKSGIKIRKIIPRKIFAFTLSWVGGEEYACGRGRASNHNNDNTSADDDNVKPTNTASNLGRAGYGKQEDMAIEVDDDDVL